MSANNWTNKNGGGWLACPHCNPDMCKIYLPDPVQSDPPLMPIRGWEHIYADPGEHVAEFNPHGAASVKTAGGKMLGIKPKEFRWLHPVPPYDRWCNGKGGLHK